jgi:hypothetical protein
MAILDIVDRVPSQPNRFKITKADGTSEYVTLERADEPMQVGTPINKELLDKMTMAENIELSDNTGLHFNTSVLDEWLEASQKSDIGYKFNIKNISCLSDSDIVDNLQNPPDIINKYKIPTYTESSMGISPNLRHIIQLFESKDSGGTIYAKHYYINDDNTWSESAMLELATAYTTHVPSIVDMDNDGVIICQYNSSKTYTSVYIEFASNTIHSFDVTTLVTQISDSEYGYYIPISNCLYYTTHHDNFMFVDIDDYVYVFDKSDYSLTKTAISAVTTSNERCLLRTSYGVISAYHTGGYGKSTDTCYLTFYRFSNPDKPSSYTSSLYTLGVASGSNSNYRYISVGTSYGSVSVPNEAVYVSWGCSAYSSYGTLTTDNSGILKFDLTTNTWSRVSSTAYLHKLHPTEYKGLFTIPKYINMDSSERYLYNYLYTIASPLQYKDEIHELQAIPFKKSHIADGKSLSSSSSYNYSLTMNYNDVNVSCLGYVIKIPGTKIYLSIINKQDFRTFIPDLEHLVPIKG